MRFDPLQVRAAAARFLSSSESMNTDYLSIASNLSAIGSADAGNTTEAVRFTQACTLAATAGSEALTAAAGALESYSESLYQCAFAFSEADEQAAESLRVR